MRPVKQDHLLAEVGGETGRGKEREGDGGSGGGRGRSGRRERVARATSREEVIVNNILTKMQNEYPRTHHPNNSNSKKN